MESDAMNTVALMPGKNLNVPVNGADFLLSLTTDFRNFVMTLVLILIIFNQRVMKTADFKLWDRVIYVPVHADGNLNHKDCEYGLVKSVNDTFVFVLYVKNGIPQMVANATRPEKLILDARSSKQHIYRI